MRFIQFKLVGPVVGAVSLLMLGLASIPYYGATRVDHAARERQETLVKRNIGLWISDIEFSLTSWTIWDEAIAKIDNNFDQEWVDRNIGASLLGTSRTRFAALLDRDDKLIYSKTADEVKDRAFFARSPRAIVGDASDLVADVRRREVLPKKPGIPDAIAISRIEVLDDDAVLLTASLFQSDFGTARPKGKQAPILIAAMPIGTSLADFFGTRFLLDDARVSPLKDIAADRARVPLAVSADGTEQVLSWRPPTPAADLLGQSLPFLTVAGIVLLLGAAFTFRVSQATVRLLIEREKDLRHAATHDNLTGLANRADLASRFDALAASGPLIVACIDLDGFKAVNDSFGHAAGDELLKGVAKRLRSHARKEDLVFRLGGDEFVILMPGIDGDEAEELCRGLAAILSLPFELSDCTARVGASFGLATVHSGNLSCDDALKLADAELYKAKSSPRIAGHEMNNAVG